MKIIPKLKISGTKIQSDILCRMLVMAALAGVSLGAHAGAAGKVQFVTGSAQLTSEAGKTRQIKKGDVVNEGDTLTTAAASATQIRMQDGGIVAVRPDTRLRFDSFKFSGKQDGSEQSFFSLAKGGFRAVTGLIGQINKPNYRISTPTATIGIRGTDHETFVVTPGSPLAATTPAGTYNKVNKGETSMTNDQGSISILPNQMGFAAAGQMPQLQPLNLDIFTVAPAPQAKGGKPGAGMRDSAVVDGTVLKQKLALGFVLPTSVNFVRTPMPIAVTYTGVVGLNANGAPIFGPITVNF